MTSGARAGWTVLVAGLLGLCGCSLGPRYVRPVDALPASFTEAHATIFDPTVAPAPSVWSAFGDPALDRLITAALARNKTLEQALAQLNEARALRGLTFYALVPTVTASAGRKRSSPSSRDPYIPPGLGTTTTFTAGFDAAWEIDLFGGALSASRAAGAELSAAEASLDAARLAVIAEVAQSYFEYRAEQDRLRVQRRNVANLEENQRLLEARLAAGRGTELDVSRARALLLATQARVPLVEAAISRDEQRLAVLTAQGVESLRQDLGPEAPLPALPALVTVGTPDAWLRRRPDVRAAERRLAAATARIGVDAADFLPQLTLVGSFGWTGQLAKDIGTSAAQRSQYGPSLSWSFLDIGRVRQRVLASKARAAGALAAYQDTVLRALEETENALAGFRTANQSAVSLTDAAAAARTATALAQRRFESGASDSLTVLDAERTQLDLEDQLATALSQRATTLAALYKALAGDYARAN